jgi:hypothetical protein
MALTADIPTYPYGTPGPQHQPIEYPIGKGASGQTIYRGSFAAISGGTTVTQGYLKNMAVPAATDKVVGLIDDYGPSCGQANTGPGLGGATLNTADGALTATVRTGTFLMATGGSAADAITITQIQTSSYVVDESHVAATSGSGATRPVAGLIVQVPSVDASIPSGMVAVDLGTASGPWGGV